MDTLASRRWTKLISVGILVIAILIGLVSSAVGVRAAGKATYTVYAGMDAPYGVAANAFGPQTIKVHRGDTITWQFLSFHNVHFDAKPADLIVTSQIDGKTMPEFNPAIAFPTMKSGDVYKAGASTGIPVAAGAMPGSPQATFSVVMDVAPGTYTYVCDVHRGMVGTIIVVDDNTAIPGPAEVEKMGKAELQAALDAGDKAILDLTKQFPPVAQGDTLQASAGGQATTASLLRFFPDTAIIEPGQSVNWTLPNGLEPHTINLPLPAAGLPSEIEFVMDAKKQPHIVPTDLLTANVKSGAEVPADGVVKSGLLLPGQSFKLKFPKAGVYSYFCALHHGMAGIIIVQAPQPPMPSQ